MTVPPRGDPDDGRDESADPSTLLRRSLVTGSALVLPTVVTVIVLFFLVDFLAQSISPLVDVIKGVVPGASEWDEWHTRGLTLLILGTIVLVVGVVAERGSGDRPAVAPVFDEFMAAIPGVGTVYSSARQVSEVLFRSDTDSFQEVKLVEFPRDDVYMFAFVTADADPAVEAAVGEGEMATLFLPLAPNPFMGGFLINVPRDRVHDVDVSVEEGVRAIVTSGVAVGDGENGDVTMRDLYDRIEATDYDARFVESFPWDGPGHREESKEEGDD